MSVGSILLNSFSSLPEQHIYQYFRESSNEVIKTELPDHNTFRNGQFFVISKSARFFNKDLILIENHKHRLDHHHDFFALGVSIRNGTYSRTVTYLISQADMLNLLLRQCFYTSPHLQNLLDQASNSDRYKVPQPVATPLYAYPSTTER